MNLETVHDQCIVPDLRYVKYFVALAEELNFRRAAGRLGISQPPLTRAIQFMEQQLRTKLFNRTNREVSLTDSGQALLPEAYRLLEQEDRMRIKAQQLAGGQTGFLRVGCISTAFFEVLPPIVNRFKELNPGIGVSIQEYETEGALAALRNREINVAFVSPVEVTPPLRLLALHQEAITVALPKDHPLSRSKKISLRQLADEAIVVCSRNISPELYDTVLAAFHGAGVTPKLEHEAMSVPSLLGYVACGVAVALVPLSTQRVAMSGIVFRELKETVSLSDICAVWNSKDDSQITRNVIAIITMA